MDYIGIMNKGDSVVPIGGHHQGLACVKRAHDSLERDLCFEVFKGTRMAIWVGIQTDDEVFQSKMRGKLCALIGMKTTSVVDEALVNFLYG